MIILSGPPGCGKGTQAQLLEERAGYVRIGIGENLRRLAEADSSIRRYLRDGELVPIGRMVSMLQDILPAVHDRVVLDGAPRDKEQASWLKAWLVSHPIDTPSYLLELDLTDELSRERTTQRDRPDDNEETVEARLQQYHTVTQPAMAGLIPAIELHQIDASGSIEVVYELIRDVIGKPGEKL